MPKVCCLYKFLQILLQTCLSDLDFSKFSALVRLKNGLGKFLILYAIYSHINLFVFLKQCKGFLSNEYTILKKVKYQVNYSLKVEHKQKFYQIHLLLQIFLRSKLAFSFKSQLHPLMISYNKSHFKK